MGQAYPMGIIAPDLSNRTFVMTKKANTAWKNMKTRCDNPNYHGYFNYWLRGISYTSDWESFSGFWKDMKKWYSDYMTIYGTEDMTLDRYDCNKNYCKDNCQWIPPQHQSKNRRCTITYQGMSLYDWSYINWIGYDTMIKRHKAWRKIEDVVGKWVR